MMAAIPACPRCIGGQVVRTYADEPPACFQCGHTPLTDDERAKGQRFAATMPERARSARVAGVTMEPSAITERKRQRERRANRG